jgi:hypothetical protein
MFIGEVEVPKNIGNLGLPLVDFCAQQTVP